MKAAVLTSIPGELTVEDVAIDKPQKNEVLIRTAAAGLCHSDLHFMEGKYPYLTPTVPGHESAGVVEAVGEDVTYVQPGDHVITCLSVFCGHCDYCLSGRTNLCAGKSLVARGFEGTPRLSMNGQPVFQFLDLSSFGEYMLVHQNAVVKVTKDIPLDRAALIGCGVTTGVGAVFNTARVQAGSTVAVIGCGGVGLNCVQGAALAGACRVIAVDMVPLKLKLAEQFGATDLVDASKGDAVQQVQELTGGGVDYSFEAIGLKVDDRAGVADAEERRHRHGDRHDPRRHDGRAARRRLPLREEDPGLEHGLEPLQGRHAALRRHVPAGPAQARRARVRSHQARGREPGLRCDEGGRGGPQRHHVRLDRGQSSGPTTGS